MKLSDLKDGTIITPEIEKTISTDHVYKSKAKAKKEKRALVLEKARKSNISAPETNFKITPAMRIWIDTAIDIVSTSPVEISTVCKLDRGNYYKWMRIPGWKEWFLDQWKNKRKAWLPKLDQIGMARASKSFDYWKAMNQKIGELLEGNGQSVNITGDKVIAILGGATNSIKPDQTSD